MTSLALLTWVGVVAEADGLQQGLTAGLNHLGPHLRLHVAVQGRRPESSFSCMATASAGGLEVGHEPRPERSGVADQTGQLAVRQRLHPAEWQRGHHDLVVPRGVEGDTQVEAGRLQRGLQTGQQRRGCHRVTESTV
jgi:hypothetical protein